MASPSASPERPPRPPRRTRLWGLAPVEAILLLFVGLAAGFGIGLLVKSTEATVAATLLGGVLLAIGTFRTIQVTREGQLIDRFTTAVDQLKAKDDDDEPEEVLVLGGIYALERIAADSRVDYYPIMEVLTAFVRTRVPRSDGQMTQEDDDVPACEHKLQNVIQAALAVLARRSPRRREYRLDLRSTDLRNAKLPHARFRKAILSGTDLRCADLREADLRDADLCGTKLSEAKLRGAKLEGAVFDTRTMWPDDFEQATEARYESKRVPSSEPGPVGAPRFRLTMKKS